MKQILFAAAALLPAWSAAFAQQAPGDTTTVNDSGYRVRVTLGGKLEPKFPGAGRDKIGPLVKVSIAHGDEPFRFSAPDDNFSLPVLRSGNFSFGAVANLVGKRTDKDVGAPLGEVKSTIEAGAFASYWVGDSLRVRGQVRKGINGHKGVVGEVGFDRVWRDGDRYVFSVGPRVLFSDARYQRAYFGVTPAAAAASGLPAYRPGGGVHALAVAASMSYQLNDRFGLFDYARYERLVGDAARSPVVRDLGSRNQVSVGLGLSYTFTTGR